MIPIRGLRAPIVAAAAPVAKRVAHRADGRLSMLVVWNEHLDAELRAHWASGKSASAIAEAMGRGISRNGVLGRARRLGLPRRASPVRRAVDDG